LLLDAGIDVWIGDRFDDGRWPLTEIAIVLVIRCGDAEMAAAPKLSALISPVVGYDFIDVDAATRRGIPVCNGEVALNRESLAEAAILLILASLYRLPQAEAALRRPDSASGLQPARMLKGKSLGIIGAGSIARAVIERLQPWQCRISLYSKSGTMVAGTESVSLSQLLSGSDVILIATSLNSDTYHLLDAERLSMMRPDAILVNIARGAIVDEPALAELLQDGGIAGAALDVFEVEPLPPESPLRTLPNVILTPHAIGHTTEARQAVVDQAAANALTLAKGQLPASCRNPAVAPAWRAAHTDFADSESA
jgi:phosphoglycerate dehydrogenase-like enzyme